MPPGGWIMAEPKNRKCGATRSWGLAGRSCLYIKKLEDIDMGVIEGLVADSAAHVDDSPNE
jgi:hypothetical protein